MIPDGGVQPTVHEVSASVSVPPPPAVNLGAAHARCPDGEILTGGGFDRHGNVGDLNVLSNAPHTIEGRWTVFVENIGNVEVSIDAVAVCMDFSP